MTASQTSTPAESTAKAMVYVRDLHKSFILHTQGGIKLEVLSSLDLTVARGECVALTGPSGAGKSTVLRCLYGNYLPGSGRILIRHGEGFVDLVTAAPREVLDLRRRTLGYVSQFLRVIPRIASIDLVCEPLLALGVEPEVARERASGLLTRLGIAERHWALAPATFSGGEQQRINIARSMIVDYPVLLLDEPTASLDAGNRRTVIELILEARARGAAIVGIFHDEEVRDAVCTRRHRIEPPGQSRDATATAMQAPGGAPQEMTA